jgi:transcriptional regulator GlxA family with amidase domain
MVASVAASAAARPHRIAVVVLDLVVAFDLGVPASIFGAARDSSGERLYEIRTCTPDGKPVRSDAGFSVLCDDDLGILTWADTILVPGVSQQSPVLEGHPLVAAALRAHSGRARIMSICTGAFQLAAAGLLDGRPATTHWAYVTQFTECFPDVQLDPGVLFVDDGDVLTSAGVAAGIDLCLHVIRRDHGSEVANRAARRCVVPAWREGGQSQFIERPVPAPAEASTTATRHWASQRLGDPLTLGELAGHARMSVRTFTRRFREETGVSPGRWLTQQRVEHARRLLETTDLPVPQVAERSGFGTAVSLRQHLQTAIGVSPGAYRRTFRATPTPADAPTPGRGRG